MMSDKNMLEDLLKPFPIQHENLTADKTNPAIRLYGRRFYKDQTPVEYLAEFLLVFASPKQDPESVKDSIHTYSFSLPTSDTPRYWAENHIALKLFAFFPSSKLETRHPVHQKSYLEMRDILESHILGTADKKEEGVRLIQSLFNGFVGVAKNRTWVTHCFLPISKSLLASELVWSHKNALQDNGVRSWRDSEKYFSSDRHIYMARGGELLFLQLANLFFDPTSNDIAALPTCDSYQHLNMVDVIELANSLENELRKLLLETLGSLSELMQVVDNVLSDFRLSVKPSYSNLGWVPQISRIEAFLFANEMQNICTAVISPLEKLDLLQTLCCMQVLRSLCFQARRVDSTEAITSGFIGNYAWIASDPEEPVASPVRLMAQSSFKRIEAMLYRVIRSKELIDGNNSSSQKEADKNGFHIFRKITKEIGLVVPRKGGGQRFVLSPELLRFLVAALVRPGERVRLTDFYQRAFAHYGLALGGQALVSGLDWCGHAGSKKSYAVAADTTWIEEALQQGGFLVELSDAVSIVHNPNGAKE